MYRTNLLQKDCALTKAPVYTVVCHEHMIRVICPHWRDGRCAALSGAPCALMVDCTQWPDMLDEPWGALGREQYR
jgi:hypothetical protein